MVTSTKKIRFFYEKADKTERIVKTDKKAGQEFIIMPKVCFGKGKKVRKKQTGKSRSAKNTEFLCIQSSACGKRKFVFRRIGFRSTAGRGNDGHGGVARENILFHHSG